MHDSYEDTLATLNLSKLLKKAPEVFKAALALRKTDVLPNQEKGLFCWHDLFLELNCSVVHILGKPFSFLVLFIRLA